jgi:serine phosphatase RsbU (regulator of sigma subunit)
MELLSYFIEHLGLAYERVHLYEEMSDKVRIKRELEIAREIQLKSLPRCEPDYHGLQICASLSAANEVAGDYYDYLEIDKSRLDIIVGDVTGKGTSAAFHMSKIQGFVQTLALDKTPAKQLLEKLNTLIHKSFEPEFFFTALYGMFDTEKKQLELYRLGHNGLIYYNSAQKRSQVLEPGGIGLGLSDQEKFQESLSSAIVNYQQDDIFAFLTDGFMEAMDADLKPFSEENICQLIAAHADKTASEIMDRLILEVGEHSNNKRFDDSTGIIIKITA